MSKENEMTRRTFHAAAMGAAVYAALRPIATFADSRSEVITQSMGVGIPVAVESTSLAYLMADDATRTPTLKVRLDDGRPEVVKRFWVEEWRSTDQQFVWNLQVAQPGSYEVTAMISAPPGSVVRVAGPHNAVEFMTAQELQGGFAWDRIRVPQPIRLAKGANRLSVRLTKPLEADRPSAALKALELINIKAAPAMRERVQAFKSDTLWLNQAKYGFMCQCGEWSYPEHGPKKPWPGMANDFDVEKFADMVHSTGAGYVVWSATWTTFYFPAPIKAIDAIVPGRTSQRDLIGDLADALGKHKIRLMLYYHVGHDPRPENKDWWSRNWVSQYDKQTFFTNWCAIMTEVGERYGDRLAGWLFDDELVYYPAPYERLGKAAKAGSSKRIIAYNPWIQARGTDFQDFQFGEGYRGSTALPISANGIWPSGPQKGLHAHGNFQLDGPDWGIFKPDTVISPPRISLDRADELARIAAEHHEALSWNLLMYEDGSVSSRSLDVLRSVRTAIRAS